MVKGRIRVRETIKSWVMDMVKSRDNVSVVYTVKGRIRVQVATVMENKKPKNQIHRNIKIT